MKHRDRVIKALNHEEVDRPPFQATFVPEFADRLRIEFNLDQKLTDPHHREWYGYDLEVLTGQDALQAGIGWFTNYYLKDEPYTDEWNVQWNIEKYHTSFGTGFYTNIAKNPLRNDDKAALNYRAPDPNRKVLYAHLDRLLKEYQQEYYIIGRVHCTIFESAWALRGLDTLMTDFYINPEIANHLLNETCNYHLEVAKNMAKMGVDMIWLGDDMGAQSSLLISPELWREYFKPRMAKIIRELKKINQDIKIAYHTDGCNYEIIPELIEIGLDILNPIQTECMDPEILKNKYGDGLCFFGGIAVQSTLPSGTSLDIKKEYAWLKNTIGKNGGWLCAPTHHVQLDTPMDNFFTLLKEIGVEDKRKKRIKS
jgi:uroporphyrinogen decarboxylase